MLFTTKKKDGTRTSAPRLTTLNGRPATAHLRAERDTSSLQLGWYWQVRLRAAAPMKHSAGVGCVGETREVAELVFSEVGPSIPHISSDAELALARGFELVEGERLRVRGGLP